jgi:hypothetical protein
MLAVGGRAIGGPAGRPVSASIRSSLCWRVEIAQMVRPETAMASSPGPILGLTAFRRRRPSGSTACRTERSESPAQTRPPACAIVCRRPPIRTDSTRSPGAAVAVGVVVALAPPRPSSPPLSSA